MRPVTASLLIVSFCLCACTPKEPSLGVYVSTLRRGPNPFPDRTDGDALYVITIQAQRVVRVRNEEVQFEHLGDRIEEIFRTRAERLLLVRVEGQVDFRDVIDALKQAPSRVQLQYGIITERSAPTVDEPSLFLNDNLIYTQYFLPTKPVPILPR
jgi:hypothetical protein